MSISGSGTQNDPYIVDTWTDYLTATSTTGNYIKWADVPNKYIDEVVISSGKIKSSRTDFNGWTIGSLFVTTSAGSDRTSQEVYYFWDGRLWNLHVEYVNITDPRCEFNTTCYNCFFDRIVTGQMDSTGYFWTHGRKDFDSYPFSPFAHCSLYECIVTLDTEDYTTSTLAGWFYNCEIYVNYKWKQTGNTVVLAGMKLSNCYVGGTLDCTDGTGEVRLIEALAHTINADDCIINIRTIASENCTIVYGGAGSTYYADDALYVDTGHYCLTTMNNGNNYTNNVATSLSIYQSTTGDIKNIDYLQGKNFPVIEDDNVRYPQYDKENHSQDWTFRINPRVNQGTLFLPFWKYPVVLPPPPAEPVTESEYIIVYDLETKQDKFNNHGLAVLRPTSCRVVEELNGAYNLQLTHSKDNEGRYKYILEMNIIKALGQLFVIQKVDEVVSGGSEYVTCYAEHISYTLNDRWIFPPFTIAGFTGQHLLDSIISQSEDMGGSWQIQYGFDMTTDIDPTEDFKDWYEQTDGVTPYEMILGSNGFISKLGGELYRDNFTLKINERMYGSQDDAFELAVGYNLKGIKRTVDLTTFCSYFRAYDVSDDNYETWWAVSWDPSTLPRAYPRNVVRSKNFSYNHEEYKEGQLERDGQAYFNQCLAPLICYELNVQDLRRNPEYKDFVNNYRFKVGDKGKVWDERLKAWNELEITRTEKDAITGDTTKVVIGSQRSFTRPYGYNPVINHGTIIVDADKIMEGTPPLTFLSAGTAFSDWTIFGAEGGVGNIQNLFYGGIENAYYTNSGVRDTSKDDYYVSSIELIDVSGLGKISFSVKNGVVTSGDVQLRIFQYDENNTFLTTNFYNKTIWSASTVVGASFTLQATCKYLRLMYRVSNTYAITAEQVGDFMLNAGTSVKAYTRDYAIPIKFTGTQPCNYYTKDSKTYCDSDGNPYITAGDTVSKTTTLTVPAPIQAGQSISMSSTGKTLTPYSGTNILTVETSVQPQVRIKYAEAVSNNG